VHVDCDLYSAARTVLSLLAERIVPGTVIVFDEYFNFPNWEQHEYKAFREFAAEHAVTYRYLAFARQQVAVRIESIGGSVLRSLPAALPVHAQSPSVQLHEPSF